MKCNSPEQDKSRRLDLKNILWEPDKAKNLGANKHILLAPAIINDEIGTSNGNNTNQTMTFLTIPLREGEETASFKPHQSESYLVHEGEEIKEMKCESARLIKQSKKGITILTSRY